MCVAIMHWRNLIVKITHARERKHVEDLREEVRRKLMAIGGRFSEQLHYCSNAMTLSGIPFWKRSRSSTTYPSLLA